MRALLALSVSIGPGVVHELMEAEVTEVVGPKGKHDPDRTAVRHGHEDERAAKPNVARLGGSLGPAVMI